MTAATLTDPVNLITELDEDSSQRYIRRVMARILGHAELAEAEAETIWVAAGFDQELWRDYLPTIQALG